MITQMRFNHGSETRKQPDTEKADFQTLLEYERQEAKLTGELHASGRRKSETLVRNIHRSFRPSNSSALFAVGELFQLSLHLTSLSCHLNSQETMQYR